MSQAAAAFVITSGVALLWLRTLRVALTAVPVAAAVLALTAVLSGGGGVAAVARCVLVALILCVCHGFGLVARAASIGVLPATNGKPGGVLEALSAVTPSLFVHAFVQLALAALALCVLAVAGVDGACLWARCAGGMAAEGRACLQPEGTAVWLAVGTATVLSVWQWHCCGAGAAPLAAAPSTWLRKRGVDGTSAFPLTSVWLRLAAALRTGLREGIILAFRAAALALMALPLLFEVSDAEGTQQGSALQQWLLLCVRCSASALCAACIVGATHAWAVSALPVLLSERLQLSDMLGGVLFAPLQPSAVKGGGQGCTVALLPSQPELFEALVGPLVGGGFAGSSSNNSGGNMHEIARSDLLVAALRITVPHSLAHYILAFPCSAVARSSEPPPIITAVDGSALSYVPPPWQPAVVFEPGDPTAASPLDAAARALIPGSLPMPGLPSSFAALSVHEAAFASLWQRRILCAEWALWAGDAPLAGSSCGSVHSAGHQAASSATTGGLTVMFSQLAPLFQLAHMVWRPTGGKTVCLHVPWVVDCNSSVLSAPASTANSPVLLAGGRAALLQSVAAGAATGHAYMPSFPSTSRWCSFVRDQILCAYAPLSGGAAASVSSFSGPSSSGDVEATTTSGGDFVLSSAPLDSYAPTSASTALADARATVLSLSANGLTAGERSRIFADVTQRRFREILWATTALLDATSVALYASAAADRLPAPSSSSRHPTRIAVAPPGLAAAAAPRAPGYTLRGVAHHLVGGDRAVVPPPGGVFLPLPFGKRVCSALALVRDMLLHKPSWLLLRLSRSLTYMLQLPVLAPATNFASQLLRAARAFEPAVEAGLWDRARTAGSHIPESALVNPLPLLLSEAVGAVSMDAPTSAAVCNSLTLMLVPTNARSKLWEFAVAAAAAGEVGELAQGGGGAMPSGAFDTADDALHLSHLGRPAGLCVPPVSNILRQRLPHGNSSSLLSAATAATHGGASAALGGSACSPATYEQVHSRPNQPAAEGGIGAFLQSVLNPYPVIKTLSSAVHALFADVYVAACLPVVAAVLQGILALLVQAISALACTMGIAPNLSARVHAYAVSMSFAAQEAWGGCGEGDADLGPSAVQRALLRSPVDATAELLRDLRATVAASDLLASIISAGVSGEDRSGTVAACVPMACFSIATAAAACAVYAASPRYCAVVGLGGEPLLWWDSRAERETTAALSRAITAVQQAASTNVGDELAGSTSAAAASVATIRVSIRMPSLAVPSFGAPAASSLSAPASLGSAATTTVVTGHVPAHYRPALAALQVALLASLRRITCALPVGYLRDLAHKAPSPALRAALLAATVTQ